ncbi:chemotaxis protein CheB [Amycolatopsis pigmentata]|uniref:protein-glutamate methylesterase n=1 Tax=Amycolatopsis pigmentata TaxID=450801 RepID=A0ABW5FZP0_9PSEU
MERPRDLVVVGASAGGVEALRDLVAGLPADFAGSVLVVLHLPPGGASALPAILRRSGPLPVTSARHGEQVKHGHIYTAPPDHHLLVDDTTIQLTHGPTENGHRPAIDTLFRSAARSRGPAATGVVLSGALDDGTTGLELIKARGGLAGVQEPEDALYRGMPDNALARVRMDFILPAKEMGPTLAVYVREMVDIDGTATLSEIDEAEVLASVSGLSPPNGGPEVVEVSKPSGLACPDCQGVLFSLDGRDTRYRCRVGHAWTAQALFEQQSREVEQALWAALRALEEQRDLATRMSHDADERGFPLVADRYRRHREERSHAVEVLRRFLYEGLTPPGKDTAGETA